jgi:N6-adenosine-specific RNA methylase IME4
MTERYQLLSPLAPDDYERLRADIAERGVMVAVEFDEDGNVLDGHHRKEIAEALGIDYPKVVRSGLPEYEKRLHAVRLNLARRHLIDGQKFLLAEKIAPDVAKRAEARRLAMLKQFAPQEPRSPLPPDGGNGDRHDNETAAEVARLVGIGSRNTYARGRKTLAKVRALAPDLESKLESGAMTMRDAAREVRQTAKAQRVAEIADTPVPELVEDETFPVILADPPWKYDYAEDTTRKIENHYPTMTVGEMGELYVPAAEACVLFCWATSPKLRDAFDLLDAWEFEYKTCMVWVKDKIGMGYYARQQHEILLIATRGTLPVPEPGDRPSSVFHGVRTTHSTKPAIAHELIEAMYPHYRKCEMFARQPREGWKVWGNQAGNAA